jgi:hypothetical protein
MTNPDLTLIEEVSRGKEDFDWIDLRNALLFQLRGNLDGSDAVSPSSTIVAPRDRIETKDEIREFILESICNMRSPPSTVQRLCELVLSISPDNLDENLFPLERVLSCSRHVTRKVLDVSPGSSSIYSVSPGRRLNRPFRQGLNRFSL